MERIAWFVLQGFMGRAGRAYPCLDYIPEESPLNVIPESEPFTTIQDCDLRFQVCVPASGLAESLNAWCPCVAAQAFY
jgi:hypothetical protein